jgi:hypothetical protein
MIFLPVSPESASGPPMINLPEGLIKYFVLSSNLSAGITGLITYSLIPSSISF